MTHNNLNNQMHIPVMLDEVLKNWVNVKDGLYIDCTFGCGGHSKQLLTKLSDQGKVIGIDADQDSSIFGSNLAAMDSRFSFVKINFSNIFNYWKSEKLPPVNGILFDLGISTFQLKNKELGFSYHELDSDLDMRIDSQNAKHASHILNTYSKKDLFSIFKKYGEIKNPTKLVNVIAEYRRDKSIETMEDLNWIVRNTFPVNQYRFNKDPSKLVIQALKIETNNEIENLETALDSLDYIIAPKGYALFITFHSIEEKILKKWIDRNCKKIIIPDYAYNIDNKFKLINNSYISPDKSEILKNWNCRSAKLWVFQKIG